MGEFNRAIPLYRSVIAGGYTDDSILHEFCLCLRRVGSYEEVRSTIEKYSDNVSRNVYLLSAKASIEIGAGEFAKAKQTIDVLARLPDNRETAAEKRAVLIAKETQDYQKALRIVDEAIERAKNSPVQRVPDLHATRCLIYCKLGMTSEARDDMNIVGNHHQNGEAVAPRLAVHILLSESRPLDALAAFEQLKGKTRIDGILKRDILQAMLKEPTISLFRRKEIEAMYAESAIKSAIFTEFDMH